MAKNRSIHHKGRNIIRRMRVIQSVLGVFHHFELARELEKRNCLDTIYSTFPWARLKREGLPRKHVQTFPYIHTPQVLLSRHYRNHSVHDEIAVLDRITFDRWVDFKTSGRDTPDVLIGLSGSVVSTALKLQSRGALFICDRGSTHMLHQERIQNEESLRWGLKPRVFDPRLRERELANYAAADAITVPSRAAARTFAEEGVPSRKVHVIPYGVRLERFFPTGRPPADSFEVLFVGSVSLRKGIPYLLQAFAALKHPNKRLTIVGAPEPDMGDLLGKLPTENVRFVGMVPQAKVSDYMSRSHVMVLPSIEEGLALVQAQALACGCPVIATAATGSEDLYTDGIEGYIVEVGDAAALTDRMQRLADDPALQADMREAALVQVRRLGGWRCYGDQWESLLHALVPHPMMVSVPENARAHTALIS